MDHRQRGHAYIFYHENFDENLNLKARNNPQDPVDELIQVLSAQPLSFQVSKFKDLTYHAIKEEIIKRKLLSFFSEFSKLILNVGKSWNNSS